MARGIDTRPCLEWLDGVESIAVSPNTPHGIVATAILMLIQSAGSEIGDAMPELHLRLDNEAHTVLLPDVTFYRLETLNALDLADRMLPNVPPDIIVEVRSPNDRPGFREEKIRRYVAWGCPVVLDVDPLLRKIIVHNGNATRLLDESGRFVDPAVPWLTFPIRDVFARLDRLGF